MRSLALVSLLAAAFAAQAADLPYGRLFYTPEQRAALENARRRNIHAEEQVTGAAKHPQVPRPRIVMVTGVVQRSDGESFAWVNGKPVEGKTQDGLRVRHTAGHIAVVLYDPEKGRTMSVKVGQQVDLTTGRIEESYETRRGQPSAPAEQEVQASGEVSAPPSPQASKVPAKGVPGNGVEGGAEEPASARDKAGNGEGQSDGDGDGTDQGG